MITVKPHPRFQSMRPGRRRGVTIGAGIVSSDGIILAADSQETVDDYLKVFRPKLTELTLISPELKCVIVGSGDGPFIDMLIERISESLEVINPYVSEAKQAIQTVVTQTCNEFWPLYSAQIEKPQAALLIGLRGNDGLCLVEASVPMIKTVDRYSFIGFGRVLALYKSKQLMPEILPVDVAAPLTAHILDAVKKNAERCGGETNMAVLTQDGHVEHKTQDYLGTAEKGYANIAWALDAFVLPLLPLAFTPEGKDTLSAIAAFGDPRAKVQNDFARHILKMANDRKAGLDPQESPHDQGHNASLMMFVAFSLLRNGVLKRLRDASIISEEEREKLHRLLYTAEQLSKGAMSVYRANNDDVARGALEIAMKILIASATNPNVNLSLVEQTLKDQQ